MANYQDVRWEGTHGPIKEKDYQPYDHWAVNIECGRSRKLYIAGSSFGSGQNFTFSDGNYLINGNFFKFEEGIEIPDPSYFCITISASNYEYKNYWFEFIENQLVLLKKPPKGFNEKKIIDVYPKSRMRSAAEYFRKI